MDEQDEEREDGTGSGVVRALAAVGLLAAGAAVALGTKTVLDARRKGTSVTRELPLVERGDAPGEDLPTVLRRAALDVAVAATTQAADSLAPEDRTPEREPAERMR